MNSTTGRAEVIRARDDAGNMDKLAHSVLDDVLYNVLSDLLMKTHRDEKTAKAKTAAIRVEKLASDASDSSTPDSKADVRVETMRARGAGGQHVNKTESAIRITHMPTGVVVSMQDHRSQQRNREDAWKVLRSRIASQRVEQREAEAARLRSSVLDQSQITRGDKIRTYNYGQDRCTDHRAAVDVHNLPDVLEGGDTLDRVMQAARDCLVDGEIRALVAEEEAKARTAASK
ncbi:hypothetical protein CDD83_11140 [Cordyceps sp. RAO-2017]|nr:hypothetical protein CDD83_11140 [Cordyceps sp. RAO-2017]